MAAPEQKMRVVFMGTPDFAATVLRHVAAWPGCEVVAAYCQPDRPWTLKGPMVGMSSTDWGRMRP